MDLKTQEKLNLILKGKPISAEQQELCDFISEGIGNAVVEARAGSSKSTSIKLMVTCVPAGKRILVLAHNKLIADHLLSELKNCGLDMTYIKVYTYHALGHHILFNHSTGIGSEIEYDEKNLIDSKYTSYFFNHINELSDGQYATLKGNKKKLYRKNVIQMLTFARDNKAQCEREIIEVNDKYSIVPILNEIDVVLKLMKWGINHMETYDFLDFIWAPYEKHLTKCPTYEADYIFVDEAQDSSPIQQNLIEICKNRTSRIIIMGDSFQTINSWCGSDSEAFETFRKMENVNDFQLPVCYRCCKSVIDLVNSNFKDIKLQYGPNIIQGEVNYEVSVNGLRNGDMVVCRNMSPLIKLYNKLLKEGKSVLVKGRDLGNGLLNVIDGVNGDTTKEIIDAVNIDMINEWISLSESYGCSLHDVVNDPTLVDSYDKVKSIETLSEGLTTRQELIDKIKGIFVDEYDPKTRRIIVDSSTTIMLSTIHRAKGLEAERVFILCPSLMPSKLSKKRWQKKEENNLIYVAYTRARSSLNFISEKEMPPFNGFSSVEEMNKELTLIKENYNL